MSATNSPAILWCDRAGCHASHDASRVTYSQFERRMLACDDGWQVARSGSDGLTGLDLCPEHKARL